MSDKPGLAPEDKALKPVTQNLVYAIVLDTWPGGAAIADFGLVSTKHYEAVYFAFRHGDVSKAELDQALGNGPLLTELMNRAEHNPHKGTGLVFVTPWDGRATTFRTHLPELEARQLARLQNMIRHRTKRLNRELEEERRSGRDHEQER